MLVLALNCGGSSIKYRLMSMPAEEVVAAGRVERVGQPGAEAYHMVGGMPVVHSSGPVPNHAAGIDQVLSLLTTPADVAGNEPARIPAVGHRVVHAGERFTGSVIATDAVLAALRDCIELAPLHNPANIAGIEACRRAMPEAVQVCVFDNTLHRDMPREAYTYGLPYRYVEKYGIWRYGFHGISFAYITARAAQIMGVPLERLRLLSLMLGSGTTANAMCYGRSVEVSTGFTPTEGLLQSTRCGDLDPAVVTFLMRKERLDPDAMDRILTTESGWLGISGVSGDLRDVEEAAERGNERASLALAVLCHRVKKYVGTYAAVMGGLDGLGFSGGIGESAAGLRSLVCRGLEFLGIRLDERLNSPVRGDAVVSAAEAPVKVLVVNTDEELYVARETFRLAGQVIKGPVLREGEGTDSGAATR